MNVHSHAIRPSGQPFRKTEMQVSLLPADRKTADILDSLRTTFAQKGFDGASMQDLARAAGMSAGNFYRYFPSKAAIIQALIAADMARMGQDFESALQSATPMDDLRAKLRVKIADHQCSTDGCLWAEIHAVAMRKPEIGAILMSMEQQVTEYLVKVFSLQSGLPLGTAHQVFAPKASLIITLFRAAAMIGSPSSTVKAQTTEYIIALIEQTLDDLSSQAQKV